MLLYSVSSKLELGISAAVTFACFIVASGLINIILRLLGIAESVSSAPDIIFVTSFILGIALSVRAMDVGIFVLFITLASYVWVDVVQKGFPEVIKKMLLAFKNSKLALVSAVHMVVTYFILYGLYRISGLWSGNTVVIMGCAYVVMFAMSVSFGSGLKVTTRATAEAVEEMEKSR